MPDSSHSRYAHVNNLRIHYREWGDPDAPDLLLVHGWSTASVVWTDVAESLRDSYHIIAPDNRGNGESDRPSSGYLLRNYADDLHELIHALQLRRPYFVGHSWGANIGTYMATEYPADISKAFLEDPVYWRMIDAFMTLLPQFHARHERQEAEVRSDALGSGMSAEEADREVYLHRRFPQEALTQVAVENRDWALRCEDFLRRIAVPTLVLVGDSAAGGYILREELAYYLSIASPEVEFRFWEGVGHMMHATQPERFVRELRAYLTD